MKIKFWDRIILFSGAVVSIIGGGTLFIAALQFEGMLRDLPVMGRIGCILLGLLLIAFGGYIFFFPRIAAGRRSEFVVQKTETGELRIAVKAIENLVENCTNLHKEMEVLSTTIENSRDGVVIDLNVSLANNISIPLAIAALQKQIKQYLIASSGIEVKEVRVSVESTQDMDPMEMEEEEPEIGEKTFPVQEKKLPLHQRLFGRADQPAIVPEPPKDETEESREDDAGEDSLPPVTDAAETPEKAAEDISAEDAPAEEEQPQEEKDREQE